ncbi:hypothetical protein VI817_001682 [Penicillium citrinum]|nr:hypothetical protein VI817_001682 [Penicillium citrinum]
MHLFKTLFLSFLFVVQIPAAAVSKHTMLVHCLNKELDSMNTEHQLSPDNLEKLKRVMDKKIMQMSFDNPTSAEQRKRPGAAEMARKAMPGVSRETIDTMLDSLGQSSRHCANDIQSTI